MKIIHKQIFASVFSLVLLMPAGVLAAVTVSGGAGDSLVSQTQMLAVGEPVPDTGTRKSVRDKLEAVADSSGVTVGAKGQKGGLVKVIATIINALLALVGVIVTILIIYSGFLWMTAAGNPEQLKKAKTIMIQAVTGLIITMAAYFISDFVVTAILNATLPA